VGPGGMDHDMAYQAVILFPVDDPGGVELHFPEQAWVVEGHPGDEGGQGDQNPGDHLSA